jgi:hypothetical protein
LNDLKQDDDFWKSIDDIAKAGKIFSTIFKEKQFPINIRESVMDKFILLKVYIFNIIN